jgi:hypothetical protein
MQISQLTQNNGKIKSSNSPLFVPPNNGSAIKRVPHDERQLEEFSAECSVCGCEHAPHVGFHLGGIRRGIILHHLLVDQGRVSEQRTATRTRLCGCVSALEHLELRRISGDAPIVFGSDLEDAWRTCVFW